MNNKFSNVKNTLLPIKMKGCRVVESLYTGKFTKEEIRKFAQFQSDAFKRAKYDGFIAINLYYPKLKPKPWRYGSFTKYGKTVSLFESSYGDEVPEPDFFTQFIILYLKK